MSAGPSPVGAMFGRIAGVYDFLNHALSLGIDRRWRAELADLCVWRGGLPLLDLAAGTLDVALALHRKFPEADIAAVDFCRPMLERGLGKLKTESIKRRIAPLEGDALELPARDGSFGCATIAFGIRNIPDRPRAFREILRVLAPGGRLCVLEFGSGKERVWGGLYNFYLDRILPRIGRAVARDKDAYAYLAETIDAFPSAPALAREMREAGFAGESYRKLTGGIVCLHWGEKPEPGRTSGASGSQI